MTSGCAFCPSCRPAVRGVAAADPVERHHEPPPVRAHLFAEAVSDPLVSRAIAEHEAGHAVAWLAFGGELRAAGVDVTEYFACTFGLTLAADRDEAGLMGVFAGPLAEQASAGVRSTSRPARSSARSVRTGRRGSQL